MSELCINGTGLFAIANTFNHSCEPNIALMSPFNDSRLRVVAIRPVAAGDELLISYIDEDMDWSSRQKRLKEKYMFECDCPKCKNKQ
jgi:SET and MYND domain-containing protein